MKHLHPTVLAGMVLFLATPAIVSAQTAYNTHANDAVSTLQTWYNSTDGEWSPPNWWPSAVANYTLTDYERLYNDNSYESSVIANSFSKAPGYSGNTNFLDSYYDDDGWWALALINYYDLTGNSTYLTEAETIFTGQSTSMTTGWTTTECDSGGMNWGTGSTYQNSIANELFLDVAAKLYNRTGDSTYLSWAQQEWTWFQSTGLIDSENLINDGLSSVTNGCGNNGAPTWTYNQGVILDGLLELWWADQDSTTLSTAQTIANSVLNSESLSSPYYPLVTAANGVLLEPTTSGANSVFKGVFIRDLMRLNQYFPNYNYTEFINTNANSIWSNDQSSSGYDFGMYWQGPYTSGTESNTNEAAALAGFNAAIDAEGDSSTGPIQRNGFGSAEMFLVDTSSSHGVWHTWQKQNSHGASASTNWSGFNEFTMGSLTTAAQGAVAVVNNLNEQTVFVPTTGGDIYYQAEPNAGGGWSAWTDMGSSSSGLTGLHAVWGINGTYLLGQTSGGIVEVDFLSSEPGSSWTGFSALGTQVVDAGYTVGVDANGSPEVFGVDSSGNLWHVWVLDSLSWGSWSEIGAPSGKALQGYLTVSRNISGTLEVFGVDTGNSAVWTNYQSTPSGSWNGWVSLGEPSGSVHIQTGFVCGLNAQGDLEFFGVGSDGNIYHVWQTTSTGNGSWTSSWSNMSGSSYTFNPDLVVFTTADGRLQVFAVSSASPYYMYSTWQTSPSGSWNGWASFTGGGKTFYPGQL